MAPGLADSEVGRAYCYRCMRVAAMCLCDHLNACPNRTEIHVLQHRRERQHAFGTVRLLRLGLANLRIHALPSDVGQHFERPEGFPVDAGVLYPGPESQDLATLKPGERPDKLIVIDGTWSQAHRLYRDTSWLRGLPRYGLRPAALSRYRIRKEPRAECLSTLESTVMALGLLEPGTPGMDGLLRAFDRMNEQQFECMVQNATTVKRVKRPRLRAMRAVPACLWQHPDQVVVVYGESALPFSYRDKGPRELSQWCAIRLRAPSVRFEGIVSTQVPMPSGDFLRDLQWRPSDLLRAETLESLQTRWRQFLRPGDSIVAWNKSTMHLARHHGLMQGVADGIVLKAVYGNTSTRAFGTLDDVVAHEGLRPVDARPFVGRAAGRLVNAHAIALRLGLWARDRMARDREAAGRS